MDIGIENIETAMMAPADMEFLTGEVSQIQANWEKRQQFRTETEMEISVLNDIKHPTAAAKYWQAIREQSVFWEQLVLLSFEYRRNELNIEEKLQALEDAKRDQPFPEQTSIEVRRIQIDLEELQFKKLGMTSNASHRVRELRLWSKILAREAAADPSFDKEDVNQHQLVSYALRFERQANNLGNAASPAETQNLMGQYHTTMRILKERGLIKEDTPRTPNIASGVHMSYGPGH